MAECLPVYGDGINRQQDPVDYIDVERQKA